MPGYGGQERPSQGYGGGQEGYGGGDLPAPVPLPFTCLSSVALILEDLIQSQKGSYLQKSGTIPSQCRIPPGGIWEQPLMFSTVSLLMGEVIPKVMREGKGITIITTMMARRLLLATHWVGVVSPRALRVSARLLTMHNMPAIPIQQLPTKLSAAAPALAAACGSLSEHMCALRRRRL